MPGGRLSPVAAAAAVNSYFPSGFAKISSLWDNMCSYTRNANGNYALCHIGKTSNSHSWRNPMQWNKGFICGRNVSAQKKSGTRCFPFHFV